MRVGIGFLIVLGCVFGAFAGFGGNIHVILEALPHEFITIGGGSIGAFIVGNSAIVIKKSLHGLKMTVKGEKWRKDEYKQLISLLFVIIRQLKTNAKALEEHVERPEESSLFKDYPLVLQDEHLVHFIADYVRMITLDFNNPYQLQELMENDIERLHHEKMKPQIALQHMADGLPAIGIVAAVLGVINTMGSINQPTEILGAMIGGALVGTFLGVLLSYCVVGPLAHRLGQVIDQDCKVFEVVRAVLVAHAQDLPGLIAVEVGRRSIPTAIAPTFQEMEEFTDALPRAIEGAPQMVKAA